MQRQEPRSFTVTADQRLLTLSTECYISEAWAPSSIQPQPTMQRFLGIWDTGATASVITQKVVDDCSLKPIATTTINHAQGTSEDVDVFLVNIGLPNRVGFSALRVAKGVLSGADVLIGMDIISQGDFAITHPDRGTKFSFRVPSQDNIDFSANDAKNSLLEREPKPSESARQRNRRQRRRKR